MRLCRLVKRSNRLLMMHVWIPPEFVRVDATVLTRVVIPLECTPTNRPPLLSVRDRSTLPLVMGRSDNVVREPRTIALECTEESTFLRLACGGSN